MSCQFIHRNQVLELDEIDAYSASLNGSDLKEWEIDSFDFINSWLSGKEIFEIPTSGSGGSPKLIAVHRADMEMSAKMTLNFLNIMDGEKALLCLPVKYVAGKMMIVRSIVGGLSLLLRNPSKDPLQEIEEDVDFLAITPYQLSHILLNRGSRDKLKGIKNVLIGGGAVDSSLFALFEDWGNNLYNTYGMTETLSHIAMSKISDKKENSYHLINDQFSISTDDRDCLLINSPYNHLPKIQTNDIVKIIDEKSFYWIGRGDNVINSGGIKFLPELLEKKISKEINDSFIISSKDDLEFGEILVLIIESENMEYYQSESFISRMKNCFDNKFEVPRKIYVLPSLSYTENGKINRIETRKIIA